MARLLSIPLHPSNRRNVLQCRLRQRGGALRPPLPSEGRPLVTDDNAPNRSASYRLPAALQKQPGRRHRHTRFPWSICTPPMRLHSLIPHQPLNAIRHSKWPMVKAICGGRLHANTLERNGWSIPAPSVPVHTDMYTGEVPVCSHEPDVCTWRQSHKQT